MAANAAAAPARSGSRADLLLRAGLPVTLLLVGLFFSFSAPSFLAPANIESVLVNNFALLAIISIAMTMAVASGGIDLSVGTALDFASLVFVSAIATGQNFYVALFGGLLAGSMAGLFNAFLIVGLGITPFLATLGTLFIGRSVQQLTTGGGIPIYLSKSKVAPESVFLGHGDLLGIATPLWIVLLVASTLAVLLRSTVFGRHVTAIGVQSTVAWYSGLPVRRNLVLVYILAAAISAIAGILLSSTVNAYVPSTGNAFLLNAIGATFIGTTIDRSGRPNILGTVLGVLLLAMVSNGLLLVGWNFYWQQVGTGALIFLVLVVTFASRRWRKVS
ncbi:MAG TPA: ABC transporter permease [Geminicoccus sp.]|jgi:ribose transport system permease protein|uniref:ABC transporter permease n=1 Tax=Geminicoccus sp. TaxID=2024832 RepID=UPI002E362910|nr:ABC transporter permease [Geminicoccus sp.]HEX2529653.1 ABC transporter permease [Geminicoccus sp.]